jgi:hypothetical protein
MTKHTKIEVNEKLLKDLLPKLEKNHIHNMITETFTKDDLIQAILFTWKQCNFVTNDRLEKYINKHFGVNK